MTGYADPATVAPPDSDLAYEQLPFPERRGRRRDLSAAVSEFYVDESAALDGGRYTEWLEMLAPGFLYQVPVPLLREDPMLPRHSGRAMLFEATTQTLTMKFGRVGQHHAWSDRPGATMRHIVGGVRVHETDEPGQFLVDSNVFVAWNRGLQESAFASAGREDLVGQDGTGGFRLLRRRVLLDAEVATHQQLSIIF
jgi:3-phenylpropionate/cinnamic acid dioxygenase small subunit